MKAVATVWKCTNPNDNSDFYYRWMLRGSAFTAVGKDYGKIANAKAAMRMFAEKTNITYKKVNLETRFNADFLV